MGAEQFECFHPASDEINTVEKAFTALYQQAEYEYGHSGYTGTIAEKDGFTVIETVTKPKAELEAATTSWGALRLGEVGVTPDWDHPAADDKWGPAACIAVNTDEGGPFGWFFYGWASS